MTLIILLTTLVGASAQDVVRTGPPPEIRQLVQATVDAVNGTADAWEAFAQARFAPGLLQQGSSEQRADLHRRLGDDFGAVTLERVMREGPDAPLQLHLSGTRASGILVLHLDAGMPPRIAELGVERGDRRGGPEAGVPPPPVNGTLSSAELDQRLDGYFTKLAADDTFSGVALVAKQGVPVFFKAYGMADRERRVPNTTQTRFNIGSINKAFTQIAVRQLIAAGKLAPTDTLGGFFPDYPQAISRTATVQQLLDHRGGLADFFGPDFERAPKAGFASNADYFRFVGVRRPSFAPGERNQYCNGCYIALGAIVEKVSGMPYETYVATHVFARAEMTGTGYPRSDRPAPDIALGYTRRGPDGELRSNVAMHGVAGSAAGGGYSTALDLLSFVKAVRAGRFPGAPSDLGIAGGAPGTNAVLEARGEWVVVVLSNLDPPTGERLGSAIAGALTR